MITEDNYSDTLEEVLAEIKRAMLKHNNKTFNSAHEGYAVCLEEVDELWDEVKKSEHDKINMRIEAIQCAAMFVRFATELTEKIN